MLSDDEHGDGLLSRSDLEIELARLALMTARQRDAVARDAADSPQFVDWFEDAALHLLHQVAPDVRPLAIERIQQIAAHNGGLAITQLEVDASTLRFAYGDPPDAG